MNTSKNTKPNPYEKQGFDFDPELIDLFDAVLQNVADEGDLKEEFTKLKFIKKLEGTYNSKPGPLKQLIEKMATIEREFTTTKLDMQRIISDLNATVRTMKSAMQAQTQQELKDAIERMQEINKRTKHYNYGIYDGK